MFNVLYYGIIADCPAFRLILNFVGHGGYYCCFYCYTKDRHDQRCRKRQYAYTDILNVRDPQSFYLNANVANLAVKTCMVTLVKAFYKKSLMCHCRSLSFAIISMSLYYDTSEMLLNL